MNRGHKEKKKKKKKELARHKRPDPTAAENAHQSVGPLINQSVNLSVRPSTIHRQSIQFESISMRDGISIRERCRARLYRGLDQVGTYSVVDRSKCIDGRA